MSTTQFASRVWIPNDENRAKYTEKNGEEAASGTNPIEGIFVDHSTRENFNKDGEYNVVTLDVEGEGHVDVHCQKTVLANEMLAAKPNFGEVVTVWYGGEKDSKTAGRAAYSIFKVRVKRELGGSPNWAGSSEDEPVHTVYQQPAPAAAQTSAPAPDPDQDIPF